MKCQQVEKTHAGATWDVVVIGGGPAGMMAAGRAAERGLKTLLLEKNPAPGKKLLITGGGRCNVTNEEYDNRKLLEKYKESGKFLFSAFAEWSVKETLDFFHGKGMPTKTGALQRVFPASNTAQSVWDVLSEYMKQGKATVQAKSTVSGFETEKNTDGSTLITAVRLKDGSLIEGRHFILATGGSSHPETGSTGDGFKWLAKLGHTVAEPSAALVPVAIRENWVKKLQGITLPEAKITLYANGVKETASKGRILFTHFGLSGPTVLNMSRSISEALSYGDATLTIDIIPTLDYGQLNARLQELFREEHNNKMLKNSLGELIIPGLVPAVVEISGISGDTWGHSVTREERLHLVQVLKALPMTVEGLLGEEKAIITSGGASLEEIDMKTMRSRLIPNLSLVGDVLDIDRPSGGYSLQLCWTTGYVAGNNA